MSERIQASGTVLAVFPQGERDRRIVIETCELGRITAFARGIQRPGNPLMAAASPFATGRFTLYAGASAYRLADAEIREYFRELSQEIPGVYYGFYFLDLVDYYGREGIDGTDMLNLLFLSLKALMNPNLDNELVRRIFELRLFVINGDFSPEGVQADPSMASILHYICTVPVGRLFTFTLENDKILQLSRIAENAGSRILDRRPKSLAILESML